MKIRFEDSILTQNEISEKEDKINKLLIEKLTKLAYNNEVSLKQLKNVLRVPRIYNKFSELMKGINDKA